MKSDDTPQPHDPSFVGDLWFDSDADGGAGTLFVWSGKGWVPVTPLRKIYVAQVIQDYAGHREDPEAAFTTMDMAQAYKRTHYIESDLKIFEVPLNPKSHKDSEPQEE